MTSSSCHGIHSGVFLQFGERVPNGKMDTPARMALRNPWGVLLYETYKGEVISEIPTPLLEYFKTSHYRPNREAREIICLVASVCPFVCMFVYLCVYALLLEPFLEPFVHFTLYALHRVVDIWAWLAEC